MTKCGVVSRDFFLKLKCVSLLFGGAPVTAGSDLNPVNASLLSQGIISSKCIGNWNELGVDLNFQAGRSEHVTHSSENSKATFLRTELFYVLSPLLWYSHSILNEL